MSMTRAPRRRKSTTPATHACRFAVDALEPRRHLDAAAQPFGSSMRLVGIDRLAAHEPWVSGAGQTVAVIDTGIDYSNPLLGGGFGPGFKVVAGHDFAADDDDPMDTDGHGTAVAGVIAADPFDQFGFRYQGIAPQAKLVALRISATPEDVPLDRIGQALQWVLDNAQKYGITVVNCSFGFGTFDSTHTEDLISNELAQLAARNIAFVSSSGNNGLTNGQGITYPAADPNAIGVGSVTTGDVISEFTQRSANLEELAVGEGVYSTLVGGGTGPFAGTSFAAPAVAGALALAHGVDTTFTLADLKSMLRASGIVNHDGDAETGDTTGLDFVRLDVDRLARLALQRRGGTQEEQDAVGVAGQFSKLAYDQFGVGHLVYYDTDAGTMFYATKNASGMWSAPETIDTSTERSGSEFSLGLDSYGRPKLAYLDGPNGDLKFASFDDVTWELKTLDYKGVTGLYPSLAIDAKDRIYISYFRKTNFDLRVMGFDPSNDVGWTRQTVDTEGSVGWSSEIAIDHDGHAAVAYGDETRHRLRLARQADDGTWSFQSFDEGVKGAAYLSLAFDDTDRPRLSYYEVQTSDLKYAAVDAEGTWTIKRVASKGATGLYTNLRVDGNTATIVFWDRRTNSIQRATGAEDGSSKKFSVTRLLDDAGRYVTASFDEFDGRWGYVASGDGRLVLDSI